MNVLGVSETQNVPVYWTVLYGELLIDFCVGLLSSRQLCSIVNSCSQMLPAMPLTMLFNSTEMPLLWLSGSRET